MLDLLLPLECGGCGMPSTRWCAVCAEALRVHPDQPLLVSPRVDPGVPVFSLGRYAGVRRRVIVEVKEHGRRDLIAPLGRALAIGIHRLLEWRMIVLPLTVVPGPTRASAARRRGGDPVFRLALAATRAHPELCTRKALRTAAFVRDSVGLNSTSRERNIAGRIRLIQPVQGTVLVVDDIITTGVTARESVRTLTRRGAQVAAVLVLAHA
jgi:predicted amidophosphoribosyltransferase